MVVERMVSIKDALKHPAWMFIIGVFVSLTSLLLSFLIFPESIGLFTVFMITFAMTPFMVNLLTYEESDIEKDIKQKLDQNFFKRHSHVIMVFTTFFSGMIVALSLVFILLPEPTVNKIFQDQITEINIIRGNFLFFNTFTKIIVNNIGVLLLSVLFSFIFGSGAIFILAWNASILSTAIGLTTKSIGGLHGIPVALATYMPHGVFEIMAYFLGGIAGGILSAAVLKKRTALFGIVVKDVTKVIVAAIVLLFIGAAIESFLIIA